MVIKKITICNHVALELGRDCFSEITLAVCLPSWLLFCQHCTHSWFFFPPSKFLQPRWSKVTFISQQMLSRRIQFNPESKSATTMHNKDKPLVNLINSYIICIKPREKKSERSLLTNSHSWMWIHFHWKGFHWDFWLEQSPLIQWDNKLLWKR